MSWNYFSYELDSKLACSCCGHRGMDDDFMQKLDAFRERIGVPLQVTSGYRCPLHNSNVSSTGETGPHTTGRAVDIRVPNSRARHLIMKYALSDDGFTRVTPAKSFIHIDDLTIEDGFDEEVMWWYG